jgi:hypothetical protein
VSVSGNPRTDLARREGCLGREALRPLLVY